MRRNGNVIAYVRSQKVEYIASIEFHFIIVELF